MPPSFPISPPPASAFPKRFKLHCFCFTVFEERIKKMIDDSDKLFKVEQKLKSIRVNTLKISREEIYERLREKFEVKEMKWYENGFFVDGEISKTVEHYLGYYYIQEASSMLPPLALELDKNDTVLDLCSAPGSKATQMAMIMENHGVIIANDISMARLKALTHNIQKSGALNCIITNYDARNFYRTGLKFDKILLDAPCTASGKIVKNKKVVENWNYKRVRYMSILQKKLIKSAYYCLNKNGIVVYSTCSLEPEENEEVIDYAVKNFDFEVEKINFKGIKTRRGIKKWEDKEYEGVEKAIRIWPHDNLTEGFFICRLRKY